MYFINIIFHVAISKVHIILPYNATDKITRGFASFQGSLEREMSPSRANRTKHAQSQHGLRFHRYQYLSPQSEHFLCLDTTELKQLFTNLLNTT